MKGRKPTEYSLKEADREYLHRIVDDGQIIQRIANRARWLLALDRGERIVDIVYWFGVSRTTLWYLWQRYQERGAAAVFDEERSGRPLHFSPSGASPDRGIGLYPTIEPGVGTEPLGLSELATDGG